MEGLSDGEEDEPDYLSLSADRGRQKQSRSRVRIIHLQEMFD